MVSGRVFHAFAHKDASFRICCAHLEAVQAEIVTQRQLLDAYIQTHPAFEASLEPLVVEGDAPAVVERMAQAAAVVGVGPMAAVAGTMAQLAAEAGLRAGAAEVIVENGGDIFLQCTTPVVIGLYAGTSPLADSLALAVQPEDTPLALCSSSSTMGHSLSLGACDLATVCATDAALADAAATHAANQVQTEGDMDRTLEAIMRIAGVRGVLLIKGERIGLVGQLPELVRNQDAELEAKVTRHRE